MTNSDFAWLNFDEAFNAANPTATRGFRIDGVPVSATQENSDITSEGYILIQAEDVGRDNTAKDDGDRAEHRILVNGRNLPAFDMIAHEGWNLWIDRIPEGFLQQGDNRLTVARAPGDNFRIANIVVHWREKATG